jgi:hypothetical protein
VLEAAPAGAAAGPAADGCSGCVAAAAGLLASEEGAVLLLGSCNPYMTASKTIQQHVACRSYDTNPKITRRSQVVAANGLPLACSLRLVQLAQGRLSLQHRVLQRDSLLRAPAAAASVVQGSPVLWPSCIVYTGGESSRKS